MHDPLHFEWNREVMGISDLDPCIAFLGHDRLSREITSAKHCGADLAADLASTPDQTTGNPKA
jgi:hypothetical protein